MGDVVLTLLESPTPAWGYPILRREMSGGARKPYPRLGLPGVEARTVRITAKALPPLGATASVVRKRKHDSESPTPAWGYRDDSCCW